MDSEDFRNQRELARRDYTQWFREIHRVIDERQAIQGKNLSPIVCHLCREPIDDTCKQIMPARWICAKCQEMPPSERMSHAKGKSE